MHTFEGEKTYFHHNGGFDGDIIIVDKSAGNKVTVQSEDLLNFVADRYVRRRIESILGNAKAEELLSILKRVVELDKKK